MTGQPRSAEHQLSAAVIELADGAASIADLLEQADIAVERIQDPEGGLGGAQILVVAAAVLPSGGLDEMRSMLGIGPDFPVLVVSDSQAAAPADSVWMTLPASSSALTAACRGLVAGSPTQGRLRARPPGGAACSVLYGDIVGAAANALERAGNGIPPDLGEVRLIAERVHSHLLRENGLVNQSLESHAEFDLPRHSANVAIIAGKIGLGLAAGVEDIVRVIMAGIVHDIGMARLPDRLLQKPGRLDAAELELLRTHPVLGAELLDGVDARYRWLTPIILQEHERMQGQGYPTGLLASAIDPLAQIIGLSDVFEALSHPRAYRSPYTALEALEQVSEMKGEYFEPGMVAALINEISAFPLDSYVQLSTGEIGQVVGTNPENILRPEVLVRWDAAWNPAHPPKRIDLAFAPDVTVARALLETELPIT
ncbi:MAG: HD domain-containing protein [Gemmatimonadota bacterium]|nr:HD domain-containing protein [Gemmatimonadota bacterium]